MELNVFIVSIYESPEELQVELVQMMRQHLEQTKNVVMGDIKKIFIMINFVLSGATLKELILETHTLIETFITILLSTEIEQNIQLLWKQLLINLADSDSHVRKSTKRVFIHFIKKTRNIEAIARLLIEQGLRDDHFYIRERCLNLVTDAIAAEKNVLFSRSGLNDARRLLEAVIVHLNDIHQSVREQATKVLKSLKEMNLENFDSAFKRLSSEHQNLFTKSLQSHNKLMDQQKFINLNLEALRDDQQFIKSEALQLSTFFQVEASHHWQPSINDDLKDWQNVRQVYKQFLTNEIKPGMSVEQMIDLFPCDLLSKLYFGFLRGDILKDCLNERDAMVREYGVRQLYESFFDTEEDSWEQMVPSRAYREESTVLSELDIFPSLKSTALEQVNSKGFMPQFFKFITYLLAREDNFKIINVILNIVNKIIQIPGIHINTYLPLSFPGLIKLLSDQRVVVRRRSLFIMRKLIKYLKKKQYLMNLMYFLDDMATDVTLQNNWHAKEELLNLISLLILEVQPNEEWFHGERKARPNIVKDLERSKRMQSNMSKISQNILDDIELSESNVTLQDRKNEDTQEVVKLVDQVEQVVVEAPLILKMDFSKILVRISFFLDDPIAKVRQAALDCLAVLCNSDNKQEYLEILFQVLDKRIYDSLIDKVEQGRVYFINIHGNLEMPVVNIQKLEEERRAFLLQLEEFRLKAEAVKHQRMLIELEEQERNRRHTPPEEPPEIIQQDEHYKVTYYENPNQQRFPLSLKDRVQKSNRQLDSLFVSEHNYIDSIKYDVIVPIGDFKMTQYSEALKGVQADRLNSNLYIYKEKEEPRNVSFDYEEFNMEDPDEHKVELLEYATKPLRFRGHEPEGRVEASKVRTNEDIRSRVRHNIKQLNEDINVDLQIPKVIKANVGAYENYKYMADGQNKDDDDEEIFIDYKELKIQHKINKKREEEVKQQEVIQNIPSKMALADHIQQQIQVKMVDQANVFTIEQKYQKRLHEFLLTFENKQLDQHKGRNARKIKNKIKSQQQNDTPLPVLHQFPILSTQQLMQPVESALAEITALILNLSVIDLELLYRSVSKLRRLMRNHIEIVYSSQVSLTQLVNDLCRLISPSKENPIYKGEFQKYSQSSSEIVRVIVMNVLLALSECAASFKRAIDPCVRLMFQSVAVWLKDEIKVVSSQAEQTMLDILKYCDDKQISDVLPRIYDKDDYMSKIYVGVLLENLVLKWQHSIFMSPHFLQLVGIISNMISDNGFDVRRQGKKVYFKLLSLGGNLNQLEQAIDGMQYYEAERMRDLIKKHNELEGDHQIGYVYHRFQNTNNQIKSTLKQDDQYLNTIAGMSMVESQEFYDFGEYKPSSQDPKLYQDSFIQNNQNYS